MTIVDFTGPSQQNPENVGGSCFKQEYRCVTISACFVVASRLSDKLWRAVTVNGRSRLQTQAVRGGSTRRVLLPRGKELKLTRAVGLGGRMLSSWGSFSRTKTRP